MTTKEELAKEFSVTLDENGIVQDLGKFELEHWSTLYFYDCMLNGDFGTLEAENPTEILYELNDEEREAFKDIAGESSKGFILTIQDAGFVGGDFVSEIDIRKFIQIVEKEQENDAINAA